MSSIRDYCPDCKEMGWACTCRKRPMTTNDPVVTPDPRASILAIIKANRSAGESQEVLARDLTTLFRNMQAVSPSGDEVEALIERVTGKPVKYENDVLTVAQVRQVVALAAMPKASGVEIAREALQKARIVLRTFRSRVGVKGAIEQIDNALTKLEGG